MMITITGKCECNMGTDCMVGDSTDKGWAAKDWEGQSGPSRSE